MALINGTNASGKLFDVVDEDREVIGSFDELHQAIACGHAAPWHAGKVNIRRDIAIHTRRHAENQAHARATRLL